MPTYKLANAKRIELTVIEPTYPYHKRSVCEHALNKPLANGVGVCTTKAAYILNGMRLCERHVGRELLLHHLRMAGIVRRPGDKLG